MIPPEYVRRQATAQRTSADRGPLMLLVLEGGQAFLVRARAALESGDYAGFVADVARTQDVLLELSQMLDHGPGGDIAASLGRLHEFMVGRLALANAQRGLESIDEVLGAYTPIVDAYRRVVHAGAAS